METSITVLTEASEPLSLFFRPAKDDHLVLKQILSEGAVGASGCVFEACYAERQKELRTDICGRKLDAIVDTGMMELASVGGFSGARKTLPWAGATPHASSEFVLQKRDMVAAQIADFVAEEGFTGVLAPSHYLSDGASDPWFAVDTDLVSRLRARLDSNGCSEVLIHYPLAIPSRVLCNSSARVKLKASLSNLPVQSVWLRIQPFGSHSGDTSLSKYIEACRQLHTMQLPVIAEKTGVLGLALMAFGAVTGVEAGISSGEKFDFGRLQRPSRKGHFGRKGRVYCGDLGGFLSIQQAKLLFEQRSVRQYACRNTDCCRHGFKSMMENPRRHFINSRMGEIDALSKVPPVLRPMEYLESFLRPATDRLGRVLGSAQITGDLRKTLETSKRRQDNLRATLGAMSQSRINSFSPIFQRRVQRAKATA